MRNIIDTSDTSFKATKLRQQVYGEDHPLTKKSLDFFTVIYGEVGRFQYSGQKTIFEILTCVIALR